MTIKEFFIQRLEFEKIAFLRVLDAISGLPQDNLNYKPDPKSKTGFELAQLFPNEFGMIATFFKIGTLDMSEEHTPKYQNINEIRTVTEKSINEVLELAKNMSDVDWETEGMAWDKMTKGQLAIDLLLDLIHHRGQLSTYIRSMGGKNPSIYGPSADEPMN